MSREPEHSLRAAVDLHIHTAPDIFPRWVSAVTAAEAARDAGMAAIVVKSHSTDTAARAESATSATGFPVYGGVVLNYSVGGLNPHAVVETARQGGRIVWMPTIGARHFIANSHQVPLMRDAIPKGVRGLTLTVGDRLRPSVDKILDLVAEHDLILASGHVAPQETGVLFAEAHARGIRRLIVTHPHVSFVGMKLDEMQSLAAMGAFLEITCFLPIAERARAIRAVGVAHCFLSTDGGTVLAPPPVQRLHESVEGLRDEGFSDAEIHYMSVAVPSYLLALDGQSARPQPPRPSTLGRTASERRTVADRAGHSQSACC